MKAYSKPDIVFEDFSLSTNIAAGCECLSHATENVCAVEIPAGSGTLIVFTTDVAGCAYTPPDGSDVWGDGICYHIPSADNNVFAS